MEALEDLSPLIGTRKMSSWGLGNSELVFEHLRSGSDVRVNTRVMRVSFNGATQTVQDDKGDIEQFDRVVVACPASAAANFLEESSWLERVILRAICYHDDDDRDFMKATLHRDPGVLPQRHRDEFLRNAAFVVDVQPGADGKPVTAFHHNMAVSGLKHIKV